MKQTALKKPQLHGSQPALKSTIYYLEILCKFQPLSTTRKEASYNYESPILLFLSQKRCLMI